MRKANVTKAMAQNFWRDVMGTIWGDPDRDWTSGIMSTEMISDYMGIAVPVTEMYLRKCADCNITEKQGGGWVV